VHLVGFTIEIYYDARSYRRQVWKHLSTAVTEWCSVDLFEVKENTAYVETKSTRPHVCLLCVTQHQ
jgi:hypothetical protein